MVICVKIFKIFEAEKLFLHLIRIQNFTGGIEVSSKEVIDVLDPYIMESRKERIQRAVLNRTYSLCLVVEGLTDFGNVSAAFRSADALGVQSVHVISSDSRKRC